MRLPELPRLKLPSLSLPQCGGGAAASLPPDRLRPGECATDKNIFLSQSGVPANADACAYEPVQRTLAVRRRGAIAAGHAPAVPRRRTDRGRPAAQQLHLATPSSLQPSPARRGGRCREWEAPRPPRRRT
jgi:hypothetical protein